MKNEESPRGLPFWRAHRAGDAEARDRLIQVCRTHLPHGAAATDDETTRWTLGVRAAAHELGLVPGLLQQELVLAVDLRAALGVDLPLDVLAAPWTLFHPNPREDFFVANDANDALWSVPFEPDGWNQRQPRSREGARLGPAVADFAVWLAAYEAGWPGATLA